MNVIDCQGCRRRRGTLDANGKRPGEVYEVGNPARPSMGHEMFFAHDGRTSLCSARRRSVDETEETDQ